MGRMVNWMGGWNGLLSCMLMNVLLSRVIVLNEQVRKRI